MMLRMLSNHPEICGLNELHFFEKLWSSADRDRLLDGEQAALLASRLIYVQRDGYIGKTDAAKYLEEGRQVVSAIPSGELLPHNVFLAMMAHETALHQRRIPCEKTPQNVFYLQEIFDLFPQARVINIVRDPRAVLLSQKRKWKRRGMGAHFITRWEVFRLRVNYHPITLSRLWNAAIRAALPYRNDGRVMQVHFEDILDAPEATLRAICAHLGVDYHPAMMDIPQASSSNEADSAEKGINRKRAGNWKKGGLSDAEIWWIERISGALMNDMGYSLSRPAASWPARAAWALTFPVKLALALLLNLNRMKSIGETIRKRLR